MSDIGYEPDNYPVVYDESEDQLYYTKNGKQPLNIGGGGPTIYTGDGSLAGDRTIDLDEHKLTVVYDSIPWLNLDPSGNTQLYAWNSDGATVQAAGIVEQATTDYGQAIFQGSYDTNGSLISATIIALGNISGATLRYIADSHTFNGNVSLSQVLNLAVFDNASPQDGDVWRQDNTNTGLKVRINGVTKTITVT